MKKTDALAWIRGLAAVLIISLPAWAARGSESAGAPGTPVPQVTITVQDSSGLASNIAWVLVQTEQTRPFTMGPGAPETPAVPSSNALWRSLEIAKLSHQAFPAWSPDGLMLAFVAFDHGRNVQVWTTDSAGRKQRRIFDGASQLETANLEFRSCALVWMRNPDMPVLATFVHERSPDPPPDHGATQVFHAVSAGTGGTAIVASRIYARAKPEAPPTQFRAYALAPDGAGPPQLLAKIDTAGMPMNQGWTTVSHAASLPDGQGLALLLLVDEDSADESHSGSLLIVRRGGAPAKASRLYRSLVQLPDGQLAGVRYDGLWLLDEHGECKTELTRLDKPCRVMALRVAPGGNRMIWAEFVFSERMLKWWRCENGRNTPLTVDLPSKATARILNVQFLSNDKLLIHAQSPAQAADLWVADLDGRHAQLWLPGLLPREVAWFQISPWGKLATVIGRYAPAGADGAVKGRQCAMRLQAGALVPGSLADAALAPMPILNFNGMRPLMPLLSWAPGQPVYAFIKGPPDFLRLTPPATGEPDERLVIVRSAE